MIVKSDIDLQSLSLLDENEEEAEGEEGEKGEKQTFLEFDFVRLIVAPVVNMLPLRFAMCYPPFPPLEKIVFFLH